MILNPKEKKGSLEIRTSNKWFANVKGLVNYLIDDENCKTD